MKTLVIHPHDSTTDFLSSIYEGADWTIIRRVNTSSGEISRQLKDHDRIICLGHGTEDGLISRVGGEIRFIISAKHIQILRQKELILIWCNADQFAKKYGLSGLITGMIISEPTEAQICCVPYTLTEINDSNKQFAFALKRGLDHRCSYNPIKAYERILDIYSGISPIEWFNRNNIFFTKA